MAQLKLFIINFLTISFSSQLITISAWDDSTYIISNTIKTDTEEIKLSLQATPPKPPTEGQEEEEPSVGEVIANVYSPLPSFHWKVKPVSWLFSLTPEENVNNEISKENSDSGFRGYRFRPTETGTFFIEYIRGRKAPYCLKNKGAGKPVAFINCGSNDLEENVGSYLWQFTPVALS